MLKVNSPQSSIQNEPVDVQSDVQQMAMDNTEVQQQTNGDAENTFEDNVPNNEQNPYDTDFDAGIDTDEDKDPKRYIQQLTGKLSQSLRQYQNDLPSPDTDLNKYVAGMILKQATNGLTDKDTKEILKKMKNDEDDVDESVLHDNNDNIDEIINDVLGIKKYPEKSCTEKQYEKPSFKKLPFTAPSFN